MIKNRVIPFKIHVNYELRYGIVLVYERRWHARKIANGRGAAKLLFITRGRRRGDRRKQLRPVGGTVWRSVISCFVFFPPRPPYWATDRCGEIDAPHPPAGYNRVVCACAPAAAAALSITSRGRRVSQFTTRRRRRRCCFFFCTFSLFFFSFLFFWSLLPPLLPPPPTLENI